MIQELLCGALLMEEKNTRAPNLLLMVSPCTSPAPSPPPPPPPAAAAAAAAGGGNEPQQNLRCPRCDSTNTKFCYYNNYNLTQPRHFCKTCRRYWTKGGALRNVPFGGGCRKAKPVPPSLSPASKSAACAKLRALPDPGAGRITLPALGAFEPGSMSLWPPGAQTSGLMSLLRPPPTVPANPNTSVRSLPPLDHLGQLAGDPYGAPLWKGAGDQFLPYQQLAQPGMILGEFPGSGLQELYQKLRASCEGAENAQSTFGTTTATAGAGSLLDPIPVAGGGDPMGFWSSLPLAWSDMSAANGAFP